MVKLPKSKTDRIVKRFEADARALVPVSDEIGGTVIYVNGRPAYYVLNGEWFQAISDTPLDSRPGGVPGEEATLPDLCGDGMAEEAVSTS